MTPSRKGTAGHAMNRGTVRRVEPTAGGRRGCRSSTALPGVRLLLVLLCLGFSAVAALPAGAETAVPEVCYRCHGGLKGELSARVVHFPFKHGMCTSCHNPHASDNKGLMREDVNDVCLDCHKGIRDLSAKSSLHGALKGGLCTDCHRPHSSENRFLLVRKEKELCWDCHESLRVQLDKAEVHAPFRSGECSSCHDAHASSEEDQLLQEPSRLCRKCHPARCKAAGVSISSATGGMDCTECHSGHAGDWRGLLGPYGHEAFLDKNCGECHNSFVPGAGISTRIEGAGLCLSCHDGVAADMSAGDAHAGEDGNACVMCHDSHGSKRKDLTVNEAGVCLGCHDKTEKRTVLMEKTLKSVRCRPVRERECFECHVPLHSDQPLYFRGGEIAVCSRCHESQHEVTHPVGPGVRDPRTGRNITCVSCHSMHAARAEFMLTFDRNRRLCIQCHRM